MSTANYNALAGLPLTKGKVAADGAAIASGQTLTFDLICANDSTLVVEADMTGAAVGDLTLAVQPYEGDNATLMPISVPQVQGVGPTLSGGHVYQYAQYDVTGTERVQIRITNNNAGAQTVTRASWKLA